MNLKFEKSKLEDVAYIVFKWLYESDMNYKGSYYAMLWNVWNNPSMRDDIAEKYPMEVAIIEMMLREGEEFTFSQFESTCEKYKELKNEL